jgi:hypothetical protein
MDTSRFPAAFTQAGDRFTEQLVYALAMQKREVAERLLAEMEAGNWELTVDDERALLTLTVGGVTLLEAQLYREPKDVRLN